MRGNTSVEQINTLSFQPEIGRWVAVTESTYASRRRAKRKFLLSALIIGGFLYFYNPMVSYQQKSVQTDTVSLSAKTTVQTQPIFVVER